MKAKPIDNEQERLFEQRLSKQLNPRNELYLLSKSIDWSTLEKEFEGLFSESSGAPAKPVRLVIGILMLQHINGYSDEGAVDEWVENPYWQFFCGYDYLQWHKPLDSSSLPRWRKRLGVSGMEKILQITIKAAINTGTIRPRSLNKAIVDTTVVEKNIAYPTDAKLYYDGIKKLIKMSEYYCIKLRQTFKFKAKTALVMSSRYSHARQMKRAEKERKKIKTY